MQLPGKDTPNKALCVINAQGLLLLFCILIFSFAAFRRGASPAMECQKLNSMLILN